VSTRRGALAALLVLAMQGDGEETGLSKGPQNPADLGTRCSVLAGREDRAYLDCGKQAPQPPAPRQVTPPEQPRPDHSGTGREGTGRRYPLRRR
jgi:hypothetical protein